MICSNDDELALEFQKTESITALRIQEVLRDTYQIKVSRNKLFDLGTVLLRKLARKIAFYQYLSTFDM